MIASQGRAQTYSAYLSPLGTIDKSGLPAMPKHKAKITPVTIITTDAFMTSIRVDLPLVDWLAVKGKSTVERVQATKLTISENRVTM